MRSFFCLICLFALPAHAFRPTFVQDAEFIDNFADTNTQEEFHHARHQAQNANRSSHQGLRIFILPHSHDDPGWVRTSDQYYEFFVRHIYTTAVAALDENRERKFQAVEMIYFHKWWREATKAQRAAARRVIKSGQLNFAVGGWVMPDEATTDYPDLIETMTAGHQFLDSEFGAKPQYGFQVDPFGASSWWALLSAKMGFKGHLVARLNYFDKGWMQNNKALEFVWRPSQALHRSQGLQIFTHIMDQYQYSAPGIPVAEQIAHLCAPPKNRTDCPGGNFYWDGDDSHPAWYWTEQQRKQGFSVYPGVNSTNIEFYSDFLVHNAQQRSAWFRTKNLLWPFGTDFQHFNASEMFASMDQIVAYVNARNKPGDRYHGVTLEYASLEDYFTAVRDSGGPWPLRGSGDFLPYNTLNCAGASQNFTATCSGNAGPQFQESWPQTWSGFFTSHMPLKIATRKHGQMLRAAEMVISAAETTHGWSSHQAATHHRQIAPLRSAVGLLPHHDAISGTMGPGCGNSLPGTNPAHCPSLPMGRPGDFGAVAGDYLSRLQDGWSNITGSVEAGVKAALGSPTAEGLSLDSKAFVEALRAGRSGRLALFNPLGWPLRRWVPVPVPRGLRVEATTSEGLALPHEILPGKGLACDEPDRQLCEAAESATPSSAHDVLYVRVDVPPQGYQVLHVAPGKHGTEAAAAAQETVQPGESLKIRTPFFTASFDGTTGSIAHVNDHTGGVGIRVSQGFHRYNSFSAYENYTSATGWSLGYTGARSGSYLLHPATGKPNKLGGRPRLEVVRGAHGHITEVRQRFSSRAQQVWRLFHDEEPMAGGFIEVESGIGPLEPNEELVSLYETEIETGRASTFFTDNNGAMMQTRIYSKNRSFPDGTQQRIAPASSYEVALNYHPIVRTAFIRDQGRHAKRQLTVLVPQSGAVTSRSQGHLELMLLRRSAQDDSKGACQVFNDTVGTYASIPMDPSMGQGCSGWKVAGTCRPDACPADAIPMNISARVSVTQWLIPGAAETSQKRRHRLSQVLNNPPMVLFGGNAHHHERHRHILAPMGQLGLPHAIHLLSFRAVSPSTYLLRLQHLADGDGPAPVQRVSFVRSGLCRLLGDHSLVQEKSITALYDVAEEGDTVNRREERWATNETERLDSLGSSGAAEQARREGGWGAAAQAGQVAAARSVECRHLEVKIHQQDIRTFYVRMRR